MWCTPARPRNASAPARFIPKCCSRLMTHEYRRAGPCKSTRNEIIARPAMQWQLALQTAESDQPVFLQIARAVIDDVKRGRLKPGAPLPGSRTLAETLGVHRNTVLAAYDELAAEGWIVREPARGTFVS